MIDPERDIYINFSLISDIWMASLLDLSSYLPTNSQISLGLSGIKDFQWWTQACKLTVFCWDSQLPKVEGVTQVFRSWFFQMNVFSYVNNLLFLFDSFSEVDCFFVEFLYFFLKCSWHMFFVCECLPRLLINSSIARKNLAFSKFGRLPSWQPPIVRCFHCWFPPLHISGCFLLEEKIWCFHDQVHIGDLQ